VFEIDGQDNETVERDMIPRASINMAVALFCRCPSPCGERKKKKRRENKEEGDEDLLNRR